MNNSKNKDVDHHENIIKSNNLVKRAFQLKDTKEKILLFQKALQLDEYNGNALIQLGLYELQKIIK